jgi:hypothetical protein
VVSRYSILSKESSTFLKHFCANLAEKSEKLYSEICGHVNALMSIAMVRATHLCLYGYQMSQMSKGHPQWRDKAGLGLFTINQLNASDYFISPIYDLPSTNPILITKEQINQIYNYLLSHSLTIFCISINCGNFLNPLHTTP